MPEVALPVEKILDNMVLALDVVDANDNIILRSGMILRAEQRKLLEKRGITEVYISKSEEDGKEAPEAVASPDGEQDEKAEKIKKHLLQVFSKVQDKENMGKLLLLALERVDKIKL